MYETINGEEVLVSSSTTNLFRSISKWTKFLSIVGFIVLIMMAFFVLSAGFLITGMNEYAEMSRMYPYTPGTFSWLYVIVYLGILVIYFFPVFYLYKFSGRLKEAVSNKSSYTLTEAFQYLNKHYMLVGVLTIVGIIFFVISCLFMIMQMANMY